MAQMCEQRRLAAARRPDEGDITVAAGATGVGKEFLNHRTPAAEHETLIAFRDECLHQVVILGELVRQT